MKPMNKLASVFLSVAALVVAGCDWAGIQGNGHIVTDQRAIEDFSEIYASGGAFKIEWRSGAPSLSITTDENLLPYIETRRVDKHLELRTRERLRPRHNVMVVVSSSTRAGARLSGASDLSASGLTGARFALETTGAADVTLDGTVDELLADMTGASDLKAKTLQARSVQISTTGAASASVNATESLRVSITGAGDVTYLGNPKSIEKHVTGAGSIRHTD
jgi:hypothetical protein